MRMTWKRVLLSGSVGFLISVTGQANHVGFAKLMFLSVLAGFILGIAYNLVDSMENNNDNSGL
jgi:hypothetical protein